MPIATLTVAILSGVILYLIRTKIRADRLRRAIVAEVQATTPVEAFKTAIAGPASLKTPIIDANLDKINMLTTDEIVLIGRYHSYMAKVRSYNDRESDDERITIPTQMSENASRVANNTADELQSNMWSNQTLWESIRGVFR